MTEKTFEFSVEEELLSLREDLDCPYCQKIKASQGHLLNRHLKFAVHYKDSGTDKFSIPCFCSARHVSKRSHWHCPRCQQIFSRSQAFKKHLKNHDLTVIEILTEEHPAETDDSMDQSTAQNQPQTHRLQCKICHSEFSNISNLRRHEKTQHDKERQPIICIDVNNGIFVTPKDQQGPRVPVHVCKSVLSQTMSCEVDICRDLMAIALKSGNPGMECQHLQRTNKAVAYAPPPLLTDKSLQVMSDRGLISRIRKQECSDLNSKALSKETDCVFPIIWDEHTFSQQFIYFSVFTNQKDKWCQFSRTRVTFDIRSGQWHCLCPVKNKAICTHRYLAMWYLFQEHPHLLKATTALNIEDDDIEERITESETPQMQHAERSADVMKMTEYLWNNKKIPENLPHELATKEQPIPESFRPLEVVCPYCPGPCPPALNDSRLVTTHGTIYCILSVTKGIPVYIKECPVCRMLVRFQEYMSGFHNFNNKVFLSLPLCSLMTSGLSNHIAVGRFLNMLEDHSKIIISHNAIRRAFYHFCAMRNFSYDFFCHRCSHNSPILIADANWKTAFDVPVHLLKRPTTTKAGPEDIQVNVKTRWEMLEKEIIAFGFCYDTTVTNPFTSTLTYSAFTPWLGKHTRVNDIIPKTEIFKGLSEKDRAGVSRGIYNVDEDAILSVLESKMPAKVDLIAACNALGVSEAGSRSDLINRLEELLLYKDVYPKMFVKLQKTGGGVLHMGCVHSVVYYESPLWWQESARDHGDALLSFKHPPTVYISDIAGRVARHVNNRTNQRFFQPNDGRLCAATEENVQAAIDKKLKIDLPWVRSIGFTSGTTVSVDSSGDRFTRIHPETGTSNRFSLYDRFHQKNQKKPEELLRSLKLVPNLAALVNSSSAEQINRELSSSKYSFCQMKDLHFMFTLRLYFHLHNQKINNKYIKDLQRQTKEVLLMGPRGKLTFGIQERRKINFPATEPQRQTEPHSSPGRTFSVSLFPMKTENLEKLLKLYQETRNDRQPILRFTDNAALNIRDLMSICPQSLIDVPVSPEYRLPWLTDDAVNSRVAQIAKGKQNTVALATHQFVVWSREWQSNRHIPESYIESLKDAEKVFWPRIVGGSLGPEWGNHFILWVFDILSKELRIYDSDGKHSTVEDEELEMLRHVFRQHDSLLGWKVYRPQMWRQTDDVNCGVFVCTMAEMDLKDRRMSAEMLHHGQLCHLRLYHASCLVSDLAVEDIPPQKKRKEAGKVGIHCLAQDINACVYQRIRKKSMYPNVKTVEWVQCDFCDGWLHSDCAGVTIITLGTDAPFSCGCHLPEPYPYESTRAAIREGLLIKLITDEEILMLQSDLVSGSLKSNRMYIHKNPTFDLKFKQIRDRCISVFDEEQLEAIIERTFTVLKLDRSELQNTSFVLEVMAPEITILILKKIEGFTRFQAEMTFDKPISF